MKVVIQCLAVSILVSVLSPLFTFTVGVPGGEKIPDLSAVSREQLAASTPEEIVRIFEAAPAVELHSWSQRFNYAFSQAQVARFYIRAIFTIFPLVFAATLIVSLLNARAVAQPVAQADRPASGGPAA